MLSSPEVRAKASCFDILFTGVVFFCGCLGFCGIFRRREGKRVLENVVVKRCDFTTTRRAKTGGAAPVVFRSEQRQHSGSRLASASKRSPRPGAVGRLTYPPSTGSPCEFVSHGLESHVARRFTRKRILERHKPKSRRWLFQRCYKVTTADPSFSPTEPGWCSQSLGRRSQIACLSPACAWRAAPALHSLTLHRGLLPDIYGFFKVRTLLCAIKTRTLAM